jgi:glycosyltransferase involved in cell wall biosynthesis
VLARSVYPLHRYGGLERHVYDLVRYLLVREVRVILITPPRSDRRPRDAEADAVFAHPMCTVKPVAYVTFPFANRRGTTILDRSTAYPVFGLRAGRAALRLARAGEVDIVHGLGASALGYALAITSPTRVPLVFNPQGLEEFGGTDPSRAAVKRLGYWPLRAAVRRCARAADRVIATDRALLDPVLTHLGVDRDRIRVVPNAIDLAELDRRSAVSRAGELCSKAGLDRDDLLLLSVGRVEANKGFDVLVHALAALASGNRLRRRWRWLLVGDGPMRGVLERHVARSGLADRVVMLGRVDADDLHGWYEAASLFVHPTLYEGSSLVTLEAMAHRLAVVSTSAGGLRDKVFPGLNGWLVPPGDPPALANAIEAAASDAARLDAFGAAGRKIVEQEFSWTAAIDRLLTVYDELLTARRSI